MMIFNNQDRSYSVGAQFIGAPPIYRPKVRRYPPQADKSAPTKWPVSVIKIIIGLDGLLPVFY